jgi:hypothetical protein
MNEKINWMVNVQVVGGPRISAAENLSVEAYDKIQVDVPGGDNAQPGIATVQVQPGGAAQVRFLAIASSHYDPALTYTVDGGDPVPLDAFQLLMGKGAVGLLGTTLTAFAFTNQAGLDKPASVEILVGRMATT